MTKREDRLKEAALEDVFAQARAAAPQPSAALIGRILADADAVRRPWWQRVGRAMGGWPTLAGLAAATVAGVWVGVNVPDLSATWLGLGGGVEIFDPNLTLILAEG